MLGSNQIDKGGGKGGGMIPLHADSTNSHVNFVGPILKTALWSAKLNNGAH